MVRFRPKVVRRVDSNLGDSGAGWRGHCSAASRFFLTLSLSEMWWRELKGQSPWKNVILGNVSGRECESRWLSVGRKGNVVSCWVLLQCIWLREPSWKLEQAEFEFEDSVNCAGGQELGRGGTAGGTMCGELLGIRLREKKTETNGPVSVWTLYPPKGVCVKWGGVGAASSARLSEYAANKWRRRRAGEAKENAPEYSVTTPHRTEMAGKLDQTKEAVVTSEESSTILTD